MTKRRFAKRVSFALISGHRIRSTRCVRAVRPTGGTGAAKAGKLINAGDVLSGELTTIKTRGGKRGAKTATYQITSEPRRLPPPNGLCNLETGPETFQLVTTSDAQAAQLKGFVGKPISVKVDEVSCAAERRTDDRGGHHQVERGQAIGNEGHQREGCLAVLLGDGLAHRRCCRFAVGAVDIEVGF